MTTLQIVQKFYPKVTEVELSKTPIKVEVTKGDVAKSKRYNRGNGNGDRKYIKVARKAHRTTNIRTSLGSK